MHESSENAQNKATCLEVLLCLDDARECLTCFHAQCVSSQMYLLDVLAHLLEDLDVWLYVGLRSQLEAFAVDAEDAIVRLCDVGRRHGSRNVCQVVTKQTQCGSRFRQIFCVFG